MADEEPLPVDTPLALVARVEAQAAIRALPQSEPVDRRFRSPLPGVLLAFQIECPQVYFHLCGRRFQVLRYFVPHRPVLLANVQQFLYELLQSK